MSIMDNRAGPNNHTGPHWYGGPRFWFDIYLVQSMVRSKSVSKCKSDLGSDTGRAKTITDQNFSDQIRTGGSVYQKLCRSLAEIGQEPFQDTPTVGVLGKKQLEAAMNAQVAQQSSKMEKLNQVLLKSMTKMELKMEEQKKELDKAQKEFEVRLTQKV